MSHTDDLDVRLMKELTSPGSFRWDVRESYSKIAKRLAIDEETLRKRMRRAQQIGLLQGMHLILNPHLIGCESAALELEVDNEDRKGSVISQIELIEGMVFIVNFLGKKLRTVFFYDNERVLARKIQLIRSICASSPGMHWNDPFPRCNMKLRKTDWLIIRAIRREARKGLPEIAKQIQVSTRTVKRRLSMMIEANAFFLMPVFDHARSAGVVCSYTVSFPDTNEKPKIDEQIKSRLARLVFSNTSAKMYSVFSVICNNVSEADEIRKSIKSLVGVKGVTMNIVKEFILVPDWLDGLINSRIGQAN